ncbi:DUF4326 domain-containing protein [Kitasatospora sp. NPDC059408]|uniref:DUF4326 domain-containing protein n=1 Tax=Kitasatospora sp. NPDC059408 TaxID=3346823 RepID=UPI00369F0960
MTRTATTPTRIQRQRTKGWSSPEGAVYVGRPSGWGNPFRLGGPYRFVDADERVLMGVVRTHDQAVELFRCFLNGRPDLQAKVRAELVGRDLTCWCPPGQACHADVLLQIANPSTED